MAFDFQPLTIPDVMLVKGPRYTDHRGYFEETFRTEDFRERINAEFVQDDFSRSTQNVLRGIHFQRAPGAQGKLVKVSRGRIFDVAVDLRRGSESFGHWVGEILSDENGLQLWVPAGFGHAYLVLSDIADVSYKVTSDYAPELDCGIRWNDPDIAIKWPTSEPLISQKDAALPLMSQNPTLFE
jgi:dTDP-4-dehydrorhamnose 3,5-epimerase